MERIDPPFNPRFSTEFNRALLAEEAKEKAKAMEFDDGPMERQYGEVMETTACNVGNHDGCRVPPIVRSRSGEGIYCQCECHGSRTGPIRRTLNTALDWLGLPTWKA